MMLRRVPLALCMLFTLAWVPDSGAGQPCPADCNGNGAVTASDVGRVSSLLLRCTPCQGRAAAVAAGCGALAGGCPAADLDGDGCFSPSEFAFIMRKLGPSVGPLPEPGSCLIDASAYPRRTRP